MKIIAIILAVALFAFAICNWLGVVWTFHPRRAVLAAVLGIVALIWWYFLGRTEKRGAGA